MRFTFVLIALVSFALPVRAETNAGSTSADFPRDLVEWTPYSGNPIFTAEGPGHWDVKIRERGWILREGGTWHLWFTGYDSTREGIKQLGYATSPDGIHWSRYPENPIHRGDWVEDMMVVKRGDTYYMFAEGANANHAEMLTSTDRVHWDFKGELDVRMADGRQPTKKPCGTPVVWIEDGLWYLFYEELDTGVWLASTKEPDAKLWINVQDDPVLSIGPGAYDGFQIAMDQVIKRDGVYYGFYHGSGDKDPPRIWNTDIARSTDLIHWQKFAGNPIVGGNKSSGIVVPDGDHFRLYTMHDRVDLFYPRTK